jgi:NAD(P)-dependent dehydrogenase (short-subunit alcohol dehydrogenase family)
MPIALITGANRGLGLETAKQLGELGYTVILGVRDPAKGDDAAAILRSRGLKVISLPLDVANAASIDRARERIKENTESLDVLINNAAIHYNTWEHASNARIATVIEAWETNVLGPWRVTQMALPLLRGVRAARIVNVSSESGSLASMGDETPAYAVTKAALNALTRNFAAELKAEGILVNAVCPGWTATDMGGGGRPIGEGARGIVWAATLPPEGPTGGFFRDGRPLPW